MKKNKLFYIALSIMFIFVAGCGHQNNPKEELDTPTTGTITITADETLRPVVEAEVSAFLNNYPDAHIRVFYKPESECFADLMNDSSRLVIVTRKLNKDESQYFQKLELAPITSTIGFDAIALIVNKARHDTVFSVDGISDILKNKVTKWKSGGDIRLVFDNKNSSLVRHFVDILGTHEIPNKNVYAVNNSKEVIDYVSKNPNSLGFVGLNWISDVDDKNVQTFMSKITVVNLKAPDTSSVYDKYYKPYQAYLAMKWYPLTRNIFVVSREARAGLGLGFTSFIAGQTGQNIIRMQGLLPMSVEIKSVEIKHQNIEIERDKK